MGPPSRGCLREPLARLGDRLKGLPLIRPPWVEEGALKPMVESAGGASLSGEMESRDCYCLALLLSGCWRRQLDRISVDGAGGSRPPLLMLGSGDLEPE